MGTKNHFGGIARASTVVLIEVNTMRIKGISPINATTAKKDILENDGDFLLDEPSLDHFLLEL